MISLQYNINSGAWFMNGASLSSYQPKIPYKMDDSMAIQLYSDTTGSNYENWTKYTGLAGRENVGAFLTADNDYYHYREGKLAEDLTAGEQTTITVTASLENYQVADSGEIAIVDSATGDTESLIYSAVTKDGNTFTFDVTGAILANSYDSNSVVEIPDSVYFTGVFDSENSDIANGYFVFSVIAEGEKLKEVLSGNTEKTKTSLELLIYEIDGDYTKEIARYLNYTAIIEKGIRGSFTNGDISTPVQNEIVSVVNVLISAGFDVQQGSDDTGAYIQIRLGDNADWSEKIYLPKGDDGEAGQFENGIDDVTFDSDDLTDGVFSLTNTELGVIGEPPVQVYDNSGVKRDNSDGVAIQWSDGALSVNVSNVTGFTGTWSIKFAGGSSDADVDLSNYYDKDTVDAKIASVTVPDSQISADTALTGDFEVDFDGSAVQIYDATEAVSSSLTISSLAFSTTTEPATNKVYTIELHVPADGDITTFVIPGTVDIIDMPDSLELVGELTYHVFVARYIMGVYQLNYSYSYEYTVATSSEEE